MSDTSKPRIAVITACYNMAGYVKDTVASVQRQTMANVEHIIVNDASTDGTRDILEQIASTEPGVSVIHHENNQGVCAARNTGAEAAGGAVDYFCFLDADDVLHPHMLQTMVQHMERHPAVGLTHCLYELIDENGCGIEEWHEKKGWLERREAGWLGTRRVDEQQTLTPTASIFGLTGIIPSCSVIRKDTYCETNGFDEDPRFQSAMGDMDLFFRLALNTTVHRINRALVQYRVHEAQKTSQAGHGASGLYEKWMEPDLLKRKHALTDKELVRARAAMKYVKLNKGLEQAFADAVSCLRERQVGMAGRKCIALAARYVRCFYPQGRGLTVYAPQWELNAE